MKAARAWIALAGLALLALAGQLVFNSGVANIRHIRVNPSNILAPGYDFWPIWHPDNLILHGMFVPHWYGAGISNAWPPPHEVLLAPFGWLSYEGAQVASIAVTAALMVFVVALWSQAPTLPSPRGGGKIDALPTGGGKIDALPTGGGKIDALPTGGGKIVASPEGRGRWRVGRVAWPFVLSAPVLSVIWIDQLQAALGLAALSVAIWAQRRDQWWLVGIAAAVGMIRVMNAIPVLCILLLGGWGKPRQLLIAIGSACAFMAPLLFVSYLWDHSFVTDYLAGLTSYPSNGAPRAATASFGPWGLVLLLGFACAVALWLVRQDAGRPLDPGRAGLGLGLTVAIAPVGGLYPGIFVLPALIRLGRRPGFGAIPWIAALAPWVVILLLSPLLLGGTPGMTLNYLSFIDYGLLLLGYPLLRIPPEARDRSARQPVAVSAA